MPPPAPPSAPTSGVLVCEDSHRRPAAITVNKTVTLTPGPGADESTMRWKKKKLSDGDATVYAPDVDEASGASAPGASHSWSHQTAPLQLPAAASGLQTDEPMQPPSPALSNVKDEPMEPMHPQSMVSHAPCRSYQMALNWAVFMATPLLHRPSIVTSPPVALDAATNDRASTSSGGWLHVSNRQIFTTRQTKLDESQSLPVQKSQVESPPPQRLRPVSWHEFPFH